MYIFARFNAVQNNTSLKQRCRKFLHPSCFNAVQNNTSLKQRKNPIPGTMEF